jgi:hypothetical protein
MSAGDVIVRVAAGRIGDAVLRRMIGAVGAQADLPIERIQDATLIVDTILDGIAADPISAILSRRERGLEIAIGPLADGEGERLLDDGATPETGSIVGALADRAWIDHDRAADAYLCVSVGRVDRSTAPSPPD